MYIKPTMFTLEKLERLGFKRMQNIYGQDMILLIDFSSSQTHRSGVTLDERTILHPMQRKIRNLSDCIFDLGFEEKF